MGDGNTWSFIGFAQGWYKYLVVTLSQSSHALDSYALRCALGTSGVIFVMNGTFASCHLVLCNFRFVAVQAKGMYVE